MPNQHRKKLYPCGTNLYHIQQQVTAMHTMLLMQQR